MSDYESPRDPVVEPDEESQGRRLSYKFQRLRERIRSAIETGELNGKLPGERVLARRFKVNAKTLSKALTDLAAEGLLERNIGLGTFVRGSSIPVRSAHRCLVLHDPSQSNCPVLKALVEAGDVQIQLQEAAEDIPPSLVNPFRSVLICSRNISDDVLKDLVVRGKNVVQLDRSIASLTTHAVMIDRLTAAADLARRLMRAGHHNLMLIGADRPTDLQRELVALLPASISLRSGVMDDVRMAVDRQVSALICTSAETAAHVMALLTGMGIDVPGQISVVGTGRIDQNDIPCSGQYVGVEEVVQAIRQILSGAAPHRPVSLWLAGQFMDAHTISPVESMDRFGG
jgi:DNA-binding HxlR family transcriptional regulator